MANAKYTKGKEKEMQAQINWLTDNIKVATVKSAYAVNLATHEFYSDLGANVLGTPVALSSRTITGGVFDAADATVASVTAGDTCSFAVVYKDTGVAGTSPLLIYCDTITNFPFTTNGGDIKLQWDNGASKIWAA